MEAASTPRITSAYLDSYVGKNVTIIGKVTQLRGEEATIDADGSITAHLNRVSLLLLRQPIPVSILLFPIRSVGNGGLTFLLGGLLASRERRPAHRKSEP